MKIGCCVGEDALLGATGNRPDAIMERLKWFQASGFDFVEPGVAWIQALEHAKFSALAAAVEKSDVPVLACNTFVPKELPIVGPDRDVKRLRDYVQRSLDRVSELGCRCVVFGSGGARRFPLGYPAERAWKELEAFCRMAAEAAGEREITIVLEPLRYQECNVLNAVATGYLFVRLVDHPRFLLLADSYHMDEIGEPISVLRQVDRALRHVHTADTGRRRPGAGDYDHVGLFRTLKEIGYGGGVSIECRWEDFRRDAPLAAAHLRRAWQKAQG